MPLLWLSLAFLTGIVLAYAIHLSTSVWLGLAGFALFLAFLRPLLNRLSSRFPRFNPRFHVIPFFPYSFLPLLVFCGAARYQAIQPDLTDPGFIAAYNDSAGLAAPGAEYWVRGVLVDPPDVRDTYVNLRVKALEIGLAGDTVGTPVRGLILVIVQPGNDLHYGDEVSVSGQLQTPPVNEDFSYRDYLARQGVYTYIPYGKVTLLGTGKGNAFLAVLFAIKERALITVYQLWPDPEAALMAGILLGDDHGIAPSVEQAFKDTGTAHIIAISGFNISIIAGLLVMIFTRLFGLRRGALAAALGIAVYTMLVGAGPAVVRAAIMGGLSLLARQVGRRQNGLNSLGIVAGVMCLFSPMLLWDASFLLSFFATLGLVLYAEPFLQAFIRFATRYLPSLANSPQLLNRTASLISEFILLTLAAQLTTLPLIAYLFGRISLIAVVANPLILPAQFPVMVLGGLAVLFGTVFLPIGKIIAPLAWPFIVYTIRMVEAFSEVPFAGFVVGKISLLWVVLFYAVLLLVTFTWPRLSTRISSVKPAIVFSALGIITVIVWSIAIRAPDGKLHLTLLDTNKSGQSGEALLVQTPAGRYLLINGGPSGSQLSDGLGRRLPLFRRYLDYLWVAGTRDAQLAALPVTLDRYRPAVVLWNGPAFTSGTSGRLQKKLTELQITTTVVEVGQQLDLGDGAVMRVLTVGTRGAIILLEWKNFRVLLPIGADFEDLQALNLGKVVGPVTALLLADNGYAPLNPPEWIDNLHPQVILLSVAAGDHDGLPSPETLSAVESYTVLRTDQNGWIQLSTDGEQMWVEVERK